MKPALTAAVVAMLLSGCAMVPTQPDANLPVIDHPPLVPPVTLGADHTARQILRSAFADHEATLRCVVVARGSELKVIVLTVTGQRALTIDWNGDEWKVDKAPLVPAQLDPQQLVADMEFALWPLPALAAPYRSAGWELETPSAGTRRLRRDGHLFAEVHYADADPWNGHLWLVNFRYGYSLEIQTEAPTD